MKKVKVVTAVVLLLLCISLNVMALEDFDPSYTYSSEKEVVNAPDSYILENSIGTDLPESASFGEIADICVWNNSLFILDSTNGKIYVYDNHDSLIKTIGEDLNLNNPSSLFVTDDGSIFIADTDHERIVITDLNGKLQKEITAPPAEETLATVPFKPTKIVVGKTGILFVIVKDDTNGVYQMKMDGSFLGFFGSVPVIPSISELFWRSISTKAQLARMLLFVPTEYSSMDIDEKGFIYATVSNKAASEIKSFMDGDGSNSQNAPIKRLNPKNEDVLIRNGNMVPAGDTVENEIASKFIDISVNKKGMYVALDETRGRVFGYDKYGNLLFIFGNMDTGKSSLSKANAICWWDNKIVISCKEMKTIKIFKPTKYINLIMEAINLETAGEYNESMERWNEVLEIYPQSELAFLNIGKNELRNKNYNKAMKIFKQIHHADYYSKALYLYRQSTGVKVAGAVVGSAIVLMVCGYFLVRFFKKKRQEKSKKQNTIWAGVKYGVYIIGHPFDGFWDMQFENRGNLCSATIILLSCVILNVISSFGSGYLISGNIVVTWDFLFKSLLAIALPIGLWCISNWLVTSLMNGSGSIKYIYMYSCYSLMPFLIGKPILIIFSHFITKNEVSLYSVLDTSILVIVLFLIFVGTLTVHQFTALRTIVSIVVTIIAMGIVVFIFLLCVAVMQQVWDFVKLVFEEITLRI